MHYFNMCIHVFYQSLKETLDYLKWSDSNFAKPYYSSFVKISFTEYLLCSGYCFRQWGYSSRKLDNNPWYL